MLFTNFEITGTMPISGIGVKLTPIKNENRRIRGIKIGDGLHKDLTVKKSRFGKPVMFEDGIVSGVPVMEAIRGKLLEAESSRIALSELCQQPLPKHFVF